MPREDWFLLRGDMVQRTVTARRETHIPEGKEPDQELQAENKQIPLPLSSLAPSLPLPSLAFPTCSSSFTLPEGRGNCLGAVSGTESRPAPSALPGGVKTERELTGPL